MVSRLSPEEYCFGVGALAAAAALGALAFALAGMVAGLLAICTIVLIAVAAIWLRSAWIVIAGAMGLLFFAFEAWGGKGGNYAQDLLLEGAIALAPLAAILAIYAGLELASRAAHTKRLPLAGWSILAAALGVAIRWGEIHFLWGASGDAATVAYILHGDVACWFWGFSAFILAGACVYRLAAGERGPIGPRWRRILVGVLLAAIVVSSLGVDGAAGVEAAVHGPVSTPIGFHATNLTELPPGARFAELDVTWAYVQPGAGLYNWSVYDWQIRYAEKHHIGLYLIADTYPPPWLFAERPQSVMVDQNQQPFTWLDVRPGTPRERLWDLSFNDPIVLNLKAAFAGAVASRYGSSPAVLWVSIQNEPTYPLDWNLVRYASYDPTTVHAFRGWLASQYPSIATLDRNISASYRSFDGVPPPANPLDPLWGTWLRFREDSLIRFTEVLVGAVRNATAKPVTIKIMAHTFTRFALTQAGLSDRVVRAFANESDVVSVDLYPASVQDLQSSLDYWQDVAHGKPLILAEFNLLLGTNVPTGGARLAEALMAMDGRVAAVFLFTVDGHYLYDVKGAQSSPAFAALELVQSHASPWNPAFPMDVAGLSGADLLAVGNLYPMYVMGMQAAGWPILPWPLILLGAAVLVV